MHTHTHKQIKQPLMMVKLRRNVGLFWKMENWNILVPMEIKNQPAYGRAVGQGGRETDWSQAQSSNGSSHSSRKLVFPTCLGLMYSPGTFGKGWLTSLSKNIWTYLDMLLSLNYETSKCTFTAFQIYTHTYSINKPGENIYQCNIIAH